MEPRTERGPGTRRGLSGAAGRAVAGALALAAALASASTPAIAQTGPCPNPNDPCRNVPEVVPGMFPNVDTRGAFPRVSLRAFPGVVGSDGRDSTVSRKATVQWERDLKLEAKLLADTAGGGFGGYHIYRVFTNRDTCSLELLRRFVYKDSLLWHFPLSEPGGDSLVTASFVDPDSAGRLIKRCRRLDPFGRCASPGDSVFVLEPPPPPPDGFPTYYAVVIAPDPNLVSRGFENKFVPDSLDNWSRCGTPGDRSTCCNLNHLALNLMTEPVFMSGPPARDLERVFVVPNPYKGRERWDPPGTHRVEFRNLPAQAEIRIYTVAGDLVRVIERNDTVSGAASWDLKNQDQRDVTAGIYIYKVTTPEGFRLFNHFVVIR